MKNSLRSKLLIVFTLIFVTLACMGAMTAINAKATPSTFEMHTGASIRVGDGTEGNPTGIRFIATIDSTEYDNLITTYGQDNVEFGMRIARCETVEELMLFPDANSMYPVSAVVENEEEGLHVISIAIHNVNAAQYNSYFTARAYVQLTDANSQTQTIYANYVEGENSRTPLQVAVAHKLLSGMTAEDMEAEFIDGIIDNVFAQGGMLFDKTEYTLAKNASIVPEVSVQGVEIETTLSSKNEGVAKIVDGAIVAVGEGSTTITATVIGATKSYTCSANVVVSADDLAITLKNGVINISGDATAVNVDGTDVALESGTTEFDLADYLKKNGYQEKEYVVYAKNDSVQSTSVSLVMKNVDNADELLAISEGTANTYFVVTDNISLAGKEVSLFGTSRAFIESLSGVLDVNGYAISSISYVEPDNDAKYKGLIAVVEQTGVVKNGYFVGTATVYDDDRAFLIGTLEGLIDNCYIDVKKFTLVNTTSGNYYATHAIIFEGFGTAKNLIVNINSCNAGLPIIGYTGDLTRVENVISISNNEKTSGLHFYRLAGANMHKYLGFDKNNTYAYSDVAALFSHSGKILKYDGTNFVFSSTVKVPYLNFAPVFDFDEQAGKIYMVNAKYGKMEAAVTVNIAQEELDVVKDKYSPQIIATLSGFYDSDALTYKSSDTNVATVDVNGVVTYVGNGTATITVTHTESGATATVPVNTYDTYIGIKDLATFLTIEGATQYVYAELLNDINISSEDFSSYANYSVNIYQNLGSFSSTALIETFSGTLNGNGKKLSVIMDVSDQTYTGSLSGVFNYIAGTGVVKNLIYTFDITAKTQIQAFVNAHAGIIKDCYFDGVIATTSAANYLINVERNTAQLNNNIYNLRLNYQGTSTSYWFRLLRIASTYQSKYTAINNAMFITSNPENYFYASQSSNNTTCYKTATNVSAYVSFADILSGNGYSITLDETDTTYKTYLYTKLTAPQYKSFGSAWSFGADGIKLCGTAIYTPAN